MVTATASGVGTPASFSLTNTAATPPGCSVSSASWQSQSIPTQTGSFTASFDATPSTATADGVIGLSSGIAAAYTDLATIVRFNASGSIDVMNNTAYASDVAMPYTANTSHHFRLVVNISNHTYSIYVTPQGGSEIQIASNYVFRSTQAAVTNLSYLSSYTSAATTTICNVLVNVASPAFDFSLSSAGNVSVTKGSSVTNTITATLSSGTTQAVSFSASSLPAGVTSSFSQTSCNPTCSSTLTLNTTSSAAAGSYTITGTGTSGSITHTTSFTLTVNNSSTASITATAGTPQSAAVNTSFGAALAATVKDASSNPVSGVTVTFTAPASGASGTFTGGLKMTTATTNSSGVATAPAFTANGTAGSYTVTATASGVGTPANFSLTNAAADTTAPTVSITAPAAGSTVSVTVTVSANASDNVGVAGVQFKIDGTNLGAEVTSAPYSISWNTTTASNGSHALTAVARDAAGTQAVSPAVTITVSNSAVTSSPGVNFSIPNNGGKQWLMTGNSASTIAGYADVQMSNAPSGIAFIAYRANGVLVAEAGVPSSPPALSGRIYMNLNGSAATGIAFANPSSQDSAISFYFTDTTGTDFGSGSFVLPANHQIAVFLDQSPFNVRSSTGGLFNSGWSTEGTFTFNSSIPVGAAALQGLINERGEFLYTTVPVAPVTGSSPDPVIVPHFADGGGWTTQVILINPSDRQITGTVQFYSPGSSFQNGQPVRISVNGTTDSTFNYALPPHAAVRLTTAGSESRTQTGSVWIIPSAGGAPTSAAIFSFVNDGITVTEATVAGLPTGTAFRMYTEEAGTRGQAGSIQTGMAIANPSPNSVTVNLEVRQMDGSSFGSPVSVTVPGNGQIAKFMQELISTLPANFQGFLKVTSNSPIAFDGLRTRVNERGDFLITTTAPRDDGQVSSGSEVTFPQVVSGGEYTTQFIVFGQSGTGKLLLNSQGGTLQ